MGDRYDASATSLLRQFEPTPMNVASHAREAVRDAMVDLSRRMCHECKRGHMPSVTDCGTWFEHRIDGYETGCTASNVWNWLKSQGKKD